MPRQLHVWLQDEEELPTRLVSSGSCVRAAVKGPSLITGERTV